jgi:hypothetical protein
MFITQLGHNIFNICMVWRTGLQDNEFGNAITPWRLYSYNMNSSSIIESVYFLYVGILEHLQRGVRMESQA